MSRAPRVVCLGVITLDALALVPRYPNADERIVGRQVAISGGGPAANAAVVLARQGVPVAFIGRVGCDQPGETAVRLLADEGVDVSGVLRDPNAPTQASCIVVAESTATRAISTLEVPPLPGVDAFGETAQALIRQAEWIHTDHLGFRPAADYVRRMDGPSRPRLSVDAGNSMPDLDVSVLDLFVPTAASLVRHFTQPETPEGLEAAARMALEQGAAAVVATDGPNGSTAWWGPRFSAPEPAGRTHVPATKTVPILSTLGAGDVFHGALLSAICRGRDWKHALQEANATAALSCRALDGRTAVPDLAELTQFLGA
ncbi:carbohydrate kinase family protein [Roseospira marina]|nr:carbohydrate kinase family protein [Roseospira marina]MBB4313928.1 sugar/nucleoside kinase (ribokinase family) [Roseospira marina]MBB5087090.1 sugar/nucleoside kinase (ribokinase family) [Roseospira marina]